jgi:NAD(P)-dependent dehydrogenase (short-subunit alcohol dehydrogenase family)
MKPLEYFLITGGNTGIGKEIALALAAKNKSVAIVSRDAAKGKHAVDEIISRTKNNNVIFIQGDLSAIQSCKALAEKIRNEVPSLQVLINNAGIWPREKKINADGFETTFMINYIAPFILSIELTDLLKTNQHSRIVNINSSLHKQGNFDLSKTPTGEDFNSTRTYSTSKLCNAMFTVELAERLSDSEITVNAIHPGVYDTNLFQGSGFAGVVIGVIKKFFKNPSSSAAAPVWLATDEKFEHVTGKYFSLKKESSFHPAVFNNELRKTLWQETEMWIHNNGVKTV